MYRIGQGFDVHKFSDLPPPGGVVMIGGIEVQSERAILAHSDGDVVLHALCDALLGALALGDIGTHFSDQDDAYKNKNSAWFVEQVMQMIKQKAYMPVNVDITIIAEVPKIKPYRSAMTEKIASLLQLELDAVSVKATTTEQLGFTGRREGIAAQVVVLLAKQILEKLT